MFSTKIIGTLIILCLPYMLIIQPQIPFPSGHSHSYIMGFSKFRIPDNPLTLNLNVLIIIFINELDSNAFLRDSN